MHTMVLGFAGYGLLLSSCVALILLLRMRCIKDILKSPLHILSTSDTLISMITSIILLINQSVPLNNLQNASPISSASEITNLRLLREDEHERYDQNETCMGFYQKLNDSWADSQDMNGTETNCAFHHVLMHYAMFLIPFANAFMSLLIYSVQCSSGMSCVDKKCSSLIQISHDVNRDSKIRSGTPASAIPHSTSRERDSGQQDLDIISRDPTIYGRTQETILTISNDESIPTNSNNNPKFTGFGLITQWLVPVLVTAILYFSKTQDMNKLRESNEMECIFKMNFPLESCDKADLADVESLRYPYGNYSELPIEVEDPDASRISYPDPEAIEQVISSVRNVVQSALNKTCYNSTELKYSNSSRPWNITKYVTMNNLIRRMTNDSDEMLEGLTDIQQALENNDLGIFRSNECVTENANDSVKTDEQTLEEQELKFFEDVVASTRIKTTLVSPSLPMQEARPQGSFPQEVVAATNISVIKDNQRTPAEYATDEISERNENGTASYQTDFDNETSTMKDTENIQKNSNEQIYADIIKRIRDTVIQVKAKGETASLKDYFRRANNDEPRPEISSRESGSRKVWEDRKKPSAVNDGETLLPTQVYTNERCFLSTKFLKMHLLILLFLIYFIPILISGILQTRAVYMCKNVFEKIEAANQKDSKTPEIEDLNRIKLDKNPPSKPGWFAKESPDGIKTDSTNQQENDHENLNGSLQTAWKVDEEYGEDDLKSKEREKAYENVLQETKSMEKLFGILKKSLMLATLMWTPAFLEILSKVFLCASTPAWLVNILYLIGVSFGMVRNFFNVNIARIDRNSNEQSQGKENSIHPSA